jgi:hypothetical protein
MSSKFLDQSTTIDVGTLFVESLQPNRPVRSDTNRQLVSGDVTIGEVTNLSTALSTKAQLDFVETGGAPANPDVGNLRLYAKIDGIYTKNSSGLEQKVGGAGTVNSIWLFDTATTGTPTSGTYRTNNATPASVTQVVIATDDSQGNSYRPLLELMNSGDHIGFQNADRTNIKFYSVTDNVDSTTYFTLTVVFQSQTNTANYTLNQPVDVIFLSGGNPFNQTLNQQDAVQFQRVTIDDAAAPSLELKDSGALNIGTVTASLDIQDSTDAIAATLSIDGAGNLELKNNNASKKLTLAANFTSVEINDDLNEVSVSGQVKISDPLTGTTTITGTGLTTVNTDLLPLVTRVEPGKIEVDTLKPSPNQPLTLSNTSESAKIQILDTPSPYDIVFTGSTNLGNIATADLIIEGTIANQPKLTIKTTDAATSNGAICFTDSTDTVAGQLSMDGAGNMELKNNNTLKNLTLASDNNNIVIENNPNRIQMNTNVVLIQDAQPTMVINDTDNTAAAANCKLYMTGTDADAASMIMDAGSLTFSNLTSGTVLAMESSGALTVQRSGAADTDSVFEVKNGAGTTSFSVNGNGDVVLGSSDNITIGNAAITQGGSENLAIGGNNMTGTPSGNANVCVGFRAGEDLGAGGLNVLVGHNAGKAIFNGGNNTCIGYFAGNSLLNDSNNVLIGDEAGTAFTSVSDIVAVGKGAGGIGTGSSYSTCIGSSSQTTGTYGIALGYNTVAAAQQCVLGSSTLAQSITVLLPGIDNNTDLGSSAKNFKNLYVNEITGTTNPPVNHEFPDKPMSGYTSTQGFVVTQTTVNGTLYAWKLFDNVVSGASGIWATAGGKYTAATPGVSSDATSLTGSYQGEWVQIECPIPLDCNGYSLTVRDDSGDDFGQNPYDWKLFASNDESTWTTLDTQTAVSWTAGETKSFSFAASAKYTFFRIAVNKIADGTVGGAAAAIAEMVFTSPTETPSTDALEVKTALNVAGTTELRNQLTVFGHTEILQDLTVGGSISSKGMTIDSTTRGLLPPRMTTTQRDAITTPGAGEFIYNTTTNKLNFYNGSAWEAVVSA